METVILTEQTLTFAYDSDRGAYVNNSNPSLFLPVEGESYVVVWDEKEYTCVAFANEAYENMVILGNAVYLGGNDTGEPFIFASIADGSGMTIFTIDTAETHVVSVYQENAGEIQSGVSIVLYDRTGAAVTYEGVETITTDTPVEGERATFTHGELLTGTEIELDMAAGDQEVSVPDGYLVKKVTLKKPETLLPENIVKNVNIGGVIGAHTGEFGIYMNGGNGREWLEPEHIVGSAFKYNETFTIESFPNVLAVGNSAFYKAINLTEIDMPLCETVEAYAFAYCSKLKDVRMPNCKSLGSYAFYSCSTLEKVYFQNCTSISAYAFQGCGGIKEISFPAISELSTIATTAFNFAAPSGLIARFDNATGMPSSTVSPIRLLSGYMTELYTPRCAQVLPYGLSGFTKLSKVVFASNPDEVLEMPIAGVAFSTWACHKCSSLEGVYAEIDGALVDMAVKPSGASCFAYCSNLKSIKIAEDLYGNIGSYAFMGCYNLENLGEFAEEKGTRVQSIYPGAFMNCQKITRFSMILGSTSNLSIYQSAFFGCSMLSQLYVSATFSQSTYIKTLGTNAFANTPMSNSSYLGYFGSIYVPSSMVSWFRATTGWSVYSERIVGY